jgi:hypothetical protein
MFGFNTLAFDFEQARYSEFKLVASAVANPSF